MTSRLDVLLLPGDAPPKHSNIKRNVLFFDSVSLVDPNDKSLVNDGEIAEQFPSALITWSERAPFPREENYADVYQEIISHTRALQTRGIVRVLDSRQFPGVDAGINWSLYHSAISNDELVHAAVPDICNDKPTVVIPSGVVSGCGISVGGYRSKYELECKPSFHIPHVDDAWSVLAHLRIGRAIKFLRLAYGRNISPLASDYVNQRIVTELSRNNLPNVAPCMSAEELADISISLEIAEPQVLESILNDMTWDDVSRLRKEILPKLSELRMFLMKRVSTVNQGGLDLEPYRQEMLKIRMEFEAMKETLVEEWEKLRIGATLKLGGTTGAAATGFTLLPSFHSWQELAMLIISSGLVATSALSSEIKSLIPAKRRVREHPLYFFDRIGLSAN